MQRQNTEPRSRPLLRRSAGYYDRKYAETEADQCTQDTPSPKIELVTDDTLYMVPDVVQHAPSWTHTPKRLDPDQPLRTPKKKPCLNKAFF